MKFILSLAKIMLWFSKIKYSFLTCVAYFPTRDNKLIQLYLSCGPAIPNKLNKLNLTEPVSGGFWKWMPEQENGSFLFDPWP